MAYGDNGLNPAYLTKQSFKFPKENTEEFQNYFIYPEMDYNEVEELRKFNCTQEDILYVSPIDLSFYKIVEATNPSDIISIFSLRRRSSFVNVSLVLPLGKYLVESA